MKILVMSIIDLQNSETQRPHHLIKHLSQKHEIMICSPLDKWKVNNTKLFEPRNIVFNNYYYYNNIIKNPIFQEVLFPFLNLRLLSKIKKFKPDVIINYNTMVSGLVVKIKENCFTIFDLADDLPEMIADSNSIPRLLSKVGRNIGNYFLYLNLKISDQITYTSESLSKYLDYEKSTHIPNGVDLQIFKKDDNALPKTKNKLIYVGALRNWVDFEEIFGAMKIDETLTLDIVGGEGLLEKWQSRSLELGIENRVNFVGSVSHSQVSKYISNSDICIVPFIQNEITRGSLPLKIFEYMAMGKPIISTPIDSIKNYFGNRIYYADNNTEFLNIIKDLNNKFDKKIIEDNIGFAKEHEWDKIFYELDIILEQKK